MFTLYGSASPNVLKISIALYELGIRYEWRHIDVWAGEQFSEEVTGLNPLSKVPILTREDGGEKTVLFESGAILVYLADAFNGLLTPRTEDRYRVLQWLFVQCANIGPMCGQLTHFSKYAPPSDGYALRRYQGQVRRLYDMLDRRLSEVPYLAGQEYSIADIATFPWVRLHENHVPELGPSTARWFATVSQRPAVAKAVRRQVEEILPADRAMQDNEATRDFNSLFPGRAP